ncbi:MAG: branched-chain amino acid ABC transporter permease [Deltaproteobacteria bacterium]|nr:branched-chain amino acid ABC transporter permease [Deltaproteobacteria bacterium]
MITGIIIYGLVNSFILALVAMGFSFTFGISGVANFAYGALYVLSGYLIWIFLNWLKIPFVLASLLTILLSALFGYVTYYAVLLRVRGIVLSEVTATFALGVGLLEFFRWLGFVTYEFSLPSIKKGSISILGFPLDYQRLFVVIAGLGLFIFIYWFTHYTRIGLSLRGIAQNERTAISLGINANRLAAISVALGSAFAAVAAIFVLPLGIISINTGYEALLIAIAVGIVGGLESLSGIILASLILGFVQVLVGFYLSPDWIMVIYLLAIILILVFMPSGLLGKFKELEERV